MTEIQPAKGVKMNKKQPKKVNNRWRTPNSVTIIQPDNANSSLIFVLRIATYKKI